MKIPIYTFCRGFYYEHELWVLLRWHHCDVIYKHYGNVAVEIIPQGTAFCYSFAVGIGLSANAIQSEMRSIYGDKYFTRPAIHVWCKKFSHGGESVVDEEPVLCSVFFRRRPMQRYYRSSRFSHAVKSACDGIKLHEFRRYVEKRNTNVWCVNMFACWTCSVFSSNSQCCSTLASCKRKLLGKILHWLTAF